MAKILKEDSDFAKRVANVMQALEDNNVQIDYLGGEFRFSDTSDNAPAYRQNMVLQDIEGQTVYELPSICEWRLAVFNS